MGRENAAGAAVFPSAGFPQPLGKLTPIEIDSALPLYVNTTQPQKSLTVGEYVASCGFDATVLTESGLIEDADIAQFQALEIEAGEATTWGVYFTVVDLGLTAAKIIDPPDDLAEYHQAQVALLTLVAQYAFAQPSDVEFDPWELLGLGLIAAGLVQQAEESLTPDLRQRLVDGGCITEEQVGWDE